MVLDRELETFRRELPRMLAEHPGEWVLIHGDEVVGFWPDEAAAFEAGCERFIPEPFLVEEVQESQRPVRLFFELPPECPL